MNATRKSTFQRAITILAVHIAHNKERNWKFIFFNLFRFVSLRKPSETAEQISRLARE